MKPPHNHTIDYVVDIETNQLPTGIGSNSTRHTDGTVKHTGIIDKARESRIVPLEVSVLRRDKNDLWATTVSDVVSSEDTSKHYKRVATTKELFLGQNVEATITFGNMSGKEDIERLFKTPNQKGKTLSQLDKEFFDKSVYPRLKGKLETPDVFYEFSTPHGKYVTSKFSSVYTSIPSQELHKRSIASVKNYVRRIDKASAVLTLEEFKSKFVNEFAAEIVNAANNKGAVNIGAWNARFESDRIAHWIHEYADKRLAKQWGDLVASDKIKFIGMESSYLDVLYGLSMEDRKLVDSMAIPIRPDTFHEFGKHRIGQVPKTFEEFVASAPHSQDFVTSISEDWLKKLKALKGSAAHDAPIDTVRADTLNTFFSKVKLEAVRLLKEQNISTDSFHETIAKQASDGRDIMHQAFRNIITKEKNKTVTSGASASKVLETFKGRLSRQILGRSASTKDLLKEVMGSKAPPKYAGHGVINSLKNMSVKNKYNYGILGTMAAIAIASTYLSSKNDSEGGMGSALGNISKLKFRKDSFEKMDTSLDGPLLHTDYSGLVFNGLATVAGITAIGYRAAKMRSAIFGFHDKFDIKNASFKDMMKQGYKLFSTGIREIEDNFPVARVFKIGSALDYVNGPLNREGRVLRAPFHTALNDNFKGPTYIDTFLEAMQKSNPEQANMLLETMQTIKDDTKISKAAFLLRRVKNKTFLNIEKISKGERKIEFEKELEFDVHTSFMRTSRANLSGRDMHPFERRVDDGRNRIRSTVAEGYVEREEYRIGTLTEKSFKEFTSQYHMPEYANSKLWKAYKWVQKTLEIGPKGINSGENVFYNGTRAIGGVKAVVGVKAVGGAASKLDSMKYTAGWLSSFPREFIQGGNRFLESPFELFIDPVKINRFVDGMMSSKSHTKQIFGKVLQKVQNPHLGLNINAMKYGVPEYMLKFAAKRILPLGIAYYGAKTLDSVMGAATFSETGRGPLSSVPISIYQNSVLAYNKMSDILGLTTMAKNQERYAPGSTGLGFFALPVGLAGSYAMMQGALNRSPKHLQSVLGKFGQSIKNNNFYQYGHGDNLAIGMAKRFASSGIFREAMQKEAFKGALNKSFGAKALETFIKAPKKTLFAAGVGLMLPFLPGLFGSTKTYAERKAEFTGQKDVAIRKNRGWLLSNQAFAGSSVQQYRQHGSYLFNSNYENRGVIWPSYSSRLLHAATFGLANRYVLEEYHKESQPVYESAPYGASVPLVGPLISKSLGWLMKPVKLMHEEVTTGQYRDKNYSPHYQSIAAQGFIDRDDSSAKTYSVLNPSIPAKVHDQDISSVSSFKQSRSQFMRQLNDMVGFKGFALESFMQGITGQDSPDQYTPYLKSAQEMYNPSQYMWQYQAGDVSVVGGEFLRRAFVDRRKIWEINNIPNELYGQSWIPKRFQTGTTFDKMPMGWLYASRKGWEFTHPEVKGLALDQYPDNIKLDILKYMSPHSTEFNYMSQRVNQNAARGAYTPFEEQRAYDAVIQSNEMKKKIYARNAANAKSLELDEVSGMITNLDLSKGTFTVDSNSTEYKLAGISTDLNDIRHGLLTRNHYNNTEALNKDAEETYDRLASEIQSNLKIGSKISFKTLSAENPSGENPEAIIGGLNEKLLRIGSPLVNTGNLSQYNLAQSMAPMGSEALGSYWNALSENNNLFANKLLGNKDYLQKYKFNRVFNRNVKLWTKPITHFLEPFIASIMNSFGFHAVPSFTKEVRANEQYWDVIKYIKFKKLAKTAQNKADADFYEQMASKTTVGADPIHDREGTKQGLSYGERDYFEYFSNEPDASKRGEIRELIPKGHRRIYDAIWTANMARSGVASQAIQEKYRILELTGGYDVDDDVLEDFDHDTDGQGNLREYVRARYVAEFAKTHKLPGEDWEGWSSQVSIDNTEVHALLEQGQQTQDYGYFEDAKRSAAYDKPAYVAAQNMHSSRLTESQFTGTILPYLVSNSNLDSAISLPSMSQFPITSSQITTDDFEKDTYIRHRTPAYASETMHKTFY